MVSPWIMEVLSLTSKGTEFSLLDPKARHGTGMRDAAAPQAVVLSRINHVKPI